jgi:hypothetical protein
MTSKRRKIEKQLAALYSELHLVVAILDSKLLWMATFEKNEISYDMSITDASVTPAAVVRHLRTSSTVLRGLRPHFEHEMRRAFVNDLYLVASRHAVIVDNVIRGHIEPRPEFSAERRDAALSGLNRFLSKKDKGFIDFFRRLRNSVVHYEGRHNAANPLNDEFLGSKILTTNDNMGEPIEMSLCQVYGLYDRLLAILDEKALMAHPQMQREIGSVSA